MLTIATACLNALSRFGKEPIKRCVTSVSELPFPHEHLILDGGSDDGTLEFLDTFTGAPRMTVLSENDRGIYDALNKALFKAQGDYIYILGLDDYIENPQEMGLSYEEKKHGYDMIVSPVRCSDGSLFPKRKSSLYDVYYKGTYCHQGVMVKTEFLRRHGGYDTNYRLVSDFKSFLQAHFDGATVKYTDHQYAVFSQDGSSSNRRALADEYKLLCNEFYPSGSAEEIVHGIIPYSSVLRLLGAHSFFSKRMGLRALRRRIYNKIKTGGNKTICVFGVPVLKRKIKL